MMENLNIDFNTLSSSIKDWGLELGFDAVGITDTKLEEAEHYLNQWISKGYHGEMTWMEKHENSNKWWHRFAIATTLSFAKARAHEISYKMGVRKNSNLFGKCVRLVGEPLCAVVGFVAKHFVKSKYETLLKDY